MRFLTLFLGAGLGLAMLFAKGVMTDLGTLGGNISVATAINPAGAGGGL